MSRKLMAVVKLQNFSFFYEIDFILSNVFSYGGLVTVSWDL